MALNAQSVVDAVAQKAGLPPAAAERAAGTIFSVIQQEVDPAIATKIFQSIPGASDLAAANRVTPSGGGILGTIATSVLGTKGGVLAAGFSQLEASGLTMAQIEAASTALVAWIRQNGGAGLARDIGNAIPGLPH
ncbi:hypothetical protein [Aestuariivirga sp.]|uniref:hypothetical protein n=1 Tax=Aestuariivirga sp. TaxID=2650926 RepID=UPI0039E214B8